MPWPPARTPTWLLAVGLVLAPVSARADEDPAEEGEKARAARDGDGAPKLAGTKAQEKRDVDVVATEEGQEGVKTYKFGAVEVEGRLRSPQILYFLRRVRAQFAGGGLGHRSFLRELSDTRRHPAFK